jgi:hypothetical protein
MATRKTIKRRAAPRAFGPWQELFGHCTLVESYSVPGFTGFHALIALRDTPGVTVAVLSKEIRHQELLTAALATGNVIDIYGRKYSNAPTPRGGTWSVDVYDVNGVILYNGV